MRNEVKIGNTNKRKWHDDSKFIIEKTKNGFNHLLDYKQLSIFSFVPELLNDTDDEVTWRFIDGQMLTKFSDDDLFKIAKILREVHKSSISLPKNNMRKRLMSYLKIINQKGLKVKVINDNFQEMQKILTNMNNINPLHNDVWFENILKDKEGNIFLIDWEYATMGDKHFDLAFFIESMRLSVEEENIFLTAYDSFDDYKAYDPLLLPKYKRLCHYITVCWAYAQEKMPFDISWMERFLETNTR